MAMKMADLEAAYTVDLHEVPARGTLSAQQVQTLLRPIKPGRVLQANGHSHVSQQDIRAHLIRVLGFGGFDVEVREVEQVFEQEGKKQQGSNTKSVWTVCYRALVRLTVRNPEGRLVAFYEDGSTATASNQPQRGDAHDLAYKSAISLSLKRAATSLGDQFGLSLYNRGQMEALVIQTLAPGYGDTAAQEAPDLQENVPDQVALGNDEVDVPLDATDPAASYEDAAPPVTDAAGEVLDEDHYAKAVEKATSADTLRFLWEDALAHQMLTQGLKNAILERKAVLDHEAKMEAEKPAEPQPDPAPEAPAAEEPPAETKAAPAKKGKTA